MHFVKRTTTSTRRRSHFVYSTVNHTAPIFKMGFSFTEQASCGKASILLTYNEESLSHIRADSFKRHANTHSHCRGHRFESGMLHSKSCISMQDFFYLHWISASSLLNRCNFANAVSDLTPILPPT